MKKLKVTPQEESEGSGGAGSYFSGSLGFVGGSPRLLNPVGTQRGALELMCNIDRGTHNSQPLLEWRDSLVRRRQEDLREICCSVYCAEMSKV